MASLGQLDLAGQSFKQAAEEAENVLKTTPSYFDAQYVLGFALSGMAQAKQNDRASLVSQSSTAFEKAYSICNSRGVVDEALRLIEELLSIGDGGELNRPRDLLRQLANA